jgi:hypothetical protein
MARKVDWSQIPWEDVNDQVSRKVIMGDRVMMVMYRFQAGLRRVPEETLLCSARVTHTSLNQMYPIPPILWRRPY